MVLLGIALFAVIGEFVVSGGNPAQIFVTCQYVSSGDCTLDLFLFVWAIAAVAVGSIYLATRIRGAPIANVVTVVVVDDEKSVKVDHATRLVKVWTFMQTSHLTRASSHPVRPVQLVSQSLVMIIGAGVIAFGAMYVCTQPLYW